MKIGDLVKIDPAYTDETWVDVVFLVLEIASPFAIIFADGKRHEVEIEQLEVFSNVNAE